MTSGSPIVWRDSSESLTRGHTAPAIARTWRRSTACFRPVADRRELLARYDEASGLVEPETIMVQELIPGGGDCQFSYGALCKDGQVLASLVAQRIRQHPPNFGQGSTCVETVNRAEVEESARRLLAAVRYSGLIEVEFKYDSRDGRYKVLDLNARAWAWHSLGSRSGIDFPYLLWRLLHGERIPEARAQTGVRWLNLLDVSAALRQMRQGVLSPRAYLQSLRGPVEFASFARDDPLPVATEFLLLAGWCLAGRIRALRGAQAG